MIVENVKTIMRNYLEMQKELRRLEEEKQELLDIWVEPDDLFVRDLENKQLWGKIDKLQNKMMQENIDHTASSRRAMQETISLIDTVKDEDFRELLRYKYIYGMAFDQIAEKSYYCISTVMRRHKKVIEQLASTI